MLTGRSLTVTCVALNLFLVSGCGSAQGDLREQLVAERDELRNAVLDARSDLNRLELQKKERLREDGLDSDDYRSLLLRLDAERLNLMAMRVVSADSVTTTTSTVPPPQVHKVDDPYFTFNSMRMDDEIPLAFGALPESGVEIQIYSFAGLALDFESADSTICLVQAASQVSNISRARVFFLKEGHCEIAATHPGNAQYLPVDTSVSVLVSPSLLMPSSPIVSVTCSQELGDCYVEREDQSRQNTSRDRVLGTESTPSATTRYYNKGGYCYEVEVYDSPVGYAPYVRASRC